MSRVGEIEAPKRATIDKNTVTYRQYKDESEIGVVIDLIGNELSEPYSIFTYRYFLRQWPFLCYLAIDPTTQRCFGCVVSKMDVHRGKMLRGYIGMLTVEKEYRHLGVGSELVRRSIAEMVNRGCEEVMLEAEVTNAGALRLYANLGFIRDKRLQRYYLNGNDAFRLKLLLPRPIATLDDGHDADEVEAARQLQELCVA
ncbi:hypothetical protein Ndes2526B_g05809 [Nannochloris sp. 'desiccata']